MRDVVIVSSARTPIGSFGGSLKSVSAIDLGTLAMKGALKKVGLKPVASDAQKGLSPDALKDQGVLDLEKEGYDYDDSAQQIAIDEVIVGNVLQAGQGQNPGRQTMIRAGLPKETPAFTLNKVCASGLKAVALGAQSIMTGSADVVLAGGQESMSNAPLALTKARWGHRMELTGIGDVHDLMVFDGLYEIFYGYHMGMTAENIADKYGISREDQDKLALLSHQRAFGAVNDGTFAQEIIPVSFMSRRKEVIVDTDERPMDTSMEKLGKLRPAFTKDGSVTAGNASGINDAAASVLLMSEEKADDLGL
ncbi:MAG: acetyl-CoA C-acyltransferase, partial [Desulfobacteraceae bacterium]|nr:acetyl-CoA C-acyltransferase [Desulfobacteraceae bacterium]